MKSLFHLFIGLTLAALLAACGGGNASPVASGTSAAPAAITSQPLDLAVVAGSPASFTVVAKDAISYQWQRSTDGGTSFADIPSANAASYTTAATVLADNNTRYRVVVSGSANSVTSSAVVLSVAATPQAPAINQGPVAQTITAGQNASFSVSASGTSLSYQWQGSTDGVNFENAAGETNATLALVAVPLAANGYRFRVVVTNSVGSVTSSAALLTVNAATTAVTITTQPASQSVVAGTQVFFDADAIVTGTASFQWQRSPTSGGSFTNISGATSATYAIAASALADSGTQYRVIVCSNGTNCVTSNAATLTVTAAAVAPSFTTQPMSVTITAGQNAQFTVAASGTPAPNLQWQLSTDGGASWSNIVGATGATFDGLNAAQANNGRQFRAVASNGSGSVNSNAAVLTVLAPANQMLAARVNHTATLLGSGKVFVVAGVVNSSSGGFFNSAETFDPATMTWSSSASLGVARGFHTATLLSNGMVLVVGGLGVNPGAPPIRLATAELYDPATNVWSAVASLATARSSHTATLLPNGKVLVAGGATNNANQLTDSAELYDPASNSWSAAGSLLAARQLHQSVVLPDGRVLLAGGNNNFVGSLASTELYDASTNSWSAGASLDRARSRLSLTLLLNGKVLAAGGWDQLGIGTVASAEVYDAVSNSWSAAGSLAAGRYDHAATLMPSGQVLITAGVGSTLLASAELYDPASNGWSATASLAVARSMHAATRLASGNVLVTGGNGTNNAPSARSEVYDIASTTWK